MSGNYVQLQNKARDVVDATSLLRTRKTAQASAEKEATQTRTAYDSIVSEYERRKGQAQSSEEDRDKLSSDLTDLRAQRASLITQKATAITTRDQAQTAVTDKETEIEDYLGEPAAEIVADPLASPPIVGVPAKVSRGQHALQALKDPIEAAVEVLHQRIVTNRIELESLQTVLSAEEKKLEDLKDVRDSMPSADVPQSLRDEIADTEAEIATQKYAITTLEASIDVDVEEVAEKTAEIQDLNDQIEAIMDDYRRAQRELEDDREIYQEALSEFQSIANQLEDIEGSVDTANATNDANVVAADGLPDSRLGLLVATLDEVETVTDSYETLRDSLSAAKTTRKTAMDAAARKKTTADREVVSAEEDLARVRKDLAVLIANQGNIEVEAAVSLLEDFLKNGSVIVSSAPVVDLSVERDIAKTCEDSKVRSLVSRIRASYLDEEEYKALRTEFRADPVGSFFNTINDPCFALLSEEEVEALRETIKSSFSKQAAALFAKYFPTRTSTTTTSRSNFVLWVLVALVVVAVAAYFVMKYRM